MKKIIKTPVLGVNAKSYLWGDELLEIALYCNEIAEKYDVSVSLNVPFLEIYKISQSCKNILINAQGVDAIEPGSTMGGILPEALKAAGADGVIINHASRPMTLNQVVKTIKRCKDVGLNTFVCIDNVVEAKMMASLHPTGIICEQSKLIGTGILADENYYYETTKAIKDIDSNILVMQGAGIKTGDDVYHTIKHGSESGGGASGIFMAEDPKAVIFDYLQGILRAKKDFGSRTVGG